MFGALLLLLATAHAGSSDEYGNDVENNAEWYHDDLIRLAEAFSFIAICLMALGAAVSELNAFWLIGVTAFGPKQGTKMKDGSIYEKRGFWLGDRPLCLALIQMKMGRAMLVALDILVAADVMETLAEPLDDISYESLGKIGIIIAIRTALAMHLSYESESTLKEKVEERVKAERAREKKIAIYEGKREIRKSMIMGNAMPESCSASAEIAAGDELGTM